MRAIDWIELIREVLVEQVDFLPKDEAGSNTIGQAASTPVSAAAPTGH